MSKNKDKPYEIKRTIEPDEIPNYQSRSKYDPIVKAAATLEKGEVLELEIDKITQISIINKVIAKAFKHNTFKVIQRKRKDGNFCYIHRL